MAGHTKGPWFVHDTIDGPITNTDVRSGDIKWVARCGPLFGRPHAPGSEIEANARLIAAAPELFDALKDAVRALDVSRKGGEYPDFEAWEAGARAAIAKATQP